MHVTGRPVEDEVDRLRRLRRELDQGGTSLERVAWEVLLLMASVAEAGHPEAPALRAEWERIESVSGASIERGDRGTTARDRAVVEASLTRMVQLLGG